MDYSPSIVAICPTAVDGSTLYMMNDETVKPSIPLRVDQAMVRSNALLTDIVAAIAIVLALAGAGSAAAGVMFVLALDFAVRGFAHPRLAVLTKISAGVLSPLLPFEHKLIFFPPKRFAARVGLVFSGTAAALFAAGAGAAGIVVTAVLAVFAALEWIANICMGCIVFNALVGIRRRFSPKSAGGEG